MSNCYRHRNQPTPVTFAHRWFLRALLLSVAVLLIGVWSALTASSAQGAARAVGADPTPGATPSSTVGPTPGQYIYDTTGLLTASEIANLQSHAAAVVRDGAPTIVYLAAKDATYDQTYQDAGNLMNAWNVESSPGARDGFVMYLNLQPGNLHHGQVVLFAGQKYFQNGPLTQDELQRIYQDDMLPPLRSGDVAGGIAAGLDAVANDLNPPPPSPLQQAASGIGTQLVDLLALLFALVAILLHRNVQSGLPRVGVPVQTRESPPNDLAPALVGALVVGRTHDAQMEATLLDFARRGLIAIEPAGIAQLRIRLLESGRTLEGYEASLWEILTSLAGNDSVILPSQLGQVRSQWGPALATLKQELLNRGWYDPQIAEKRQPYYVAGTIGALGAILALIVAIVGQQGWALLGVAIFAGVAVWLYVAGARIANTSAEGELVATPWREYRAGILLVHADPRSDADLSVALPYAVAMEIVSSLDYRLQLASERGDMPAWFVRNLQPTPATMRRRGIYSGFYPYWTVWHSTLYPAPSSSGGGGGFGGGGAAGGGGGGGGGF